MFHKIRHLINKIMNASPEDKFNQYTKDLIRIGQGKTSLSQLVYDMIKNKESYIGYVIDHTPGSCCQRVR